MTRHVRATSLLSLGLVAAGIISCKSTGNRGAALKGDESEPAAAPAPLDPTHPFTKNYRQIFAQNNLYKREFYKTFGAGQGTIDGEIGEFVQIGRSINENIQKERSQLRANNGKPRRGFHAKSHGCLTGRLVLRDQRDERTKVGVFSGNEPANKCLNVLVRFSNAVGRDYFDARPDVRGFAIKIFGADVDAQGKKIAGEPRSIDINMTNGPVPFGYDTLSFSKFGEAQAAGNIALVKFLATNGGSKGVQGQAPGLDGPRDALRPNLSLADKILKNVAPPVPSMATARFWSGHPYLMGKDLAAKFNVVPAGGARDDRSIWDANKLEKMLEGKFDDARRALTDTNYLRTDLMKRVHAPGGVRFTLMAQFDQGNETTPIEDTLTEWTEQASPSTPIGEITLDGVYDDASCDVLSFTPGRFNSNHRPLGNMGRGRIFAYEASAAIRPGVSFQDPPAEQVFSQGLPCDSGGGT